MFFYILFIIWTLTPGELTVGAKQSFCEDEQYLRKHNQRWKKKGSRLE